MASGAAAGAADAESAPARQQEYQPLHELTPQSGAIGSWLLQVGEAPLVREYTYTYNGKTCHGKRFEVILMSPDASAYCVGQYRRRGAGQNGDKEFGRNVERFKMNTVWCASKVAVSKEKPCYISSPVKIMIDLNTTKMAPVLQSMHKMPSEPTPLANLHTILMCPQHQRQSGRRHERASALVRFGHLQIHSQDAQD